MCPATMTMVRSYSDDERVVALDPAVRGEDEEAEPDREQLAVLGDRLPVELDDVAESLGVVAPAEAEPLGADPVLVRRSPREPRSPRIPVPRGSPSWRSRVAPRSRGSPAAAGGCASRPPSRARRSSAGAGRHRARSRARGTSPPTRPRSALRFRRKPVSRSSVPPLMVWLLRRQRSRRKGHTSITSRVTRTPR